MAANWFMAEADQFGNPVGPRVCITDSVLDTCGEANFDETSGEQEQAAAALVESAYGVKGGVCRGNYWTA